MSLNIKTVSGLKRINGVYIKPTTVAKTITANGTYSASSDGVDGYSRVTVNVTPAFVELPANLMSYESGVTDLSHGFVVLDSSGTIESGTYTIDGAEYSGLRLAGASTIATPDNMSAGTLMAKVIVTGFGMSRDQRIFSPKRGTDQNWRFSVWSLSSDDRLRYNLRNCEVLDNSLVNLGYSVDYADPNITKDLILNKELIIEIRNDNTGYRTLYVNDVAKARKWTEGSSTSSNDGIWNSFTVGGNGTTGSDILVTEFKWIIE